LAPKPIGWGDVTPSQWIWNEFQIEKDKNGNPDPRIEQTFLFPHFDSTKTAYDPNYTIFGKSQSDGTDGWAKLSWSITTNNLGYTDPTFKMIIRKNLVEDVTLNGAWQSWINRRIVRYADVLLLYAECLNETGNTAGAYPYINLVRNRSNMSNLEIAHPEIGSNQSLMRDQIIHERALEFACEWWRYIDLLRWGWFPDSEKGIPGKLDLLKSHDPEYKDYVDGREYMAIPKDEINRNPKLKQNPAWN
jgi:starch-binding outer membrane protein, SusD/RagB family